MRYKRKLPDAIGPWSCDSGAFSELEDNGRFTISSNDYAVEVKRYRSHIGNMLWAAPQDWMCEERILKKTGKSIVEHQHLTVNNYLDLMTAAPTVPWIPVLQGWSFADYLRCTELYEAAGVSLKSLPLVGLGSVCRRQNTLMVEQLIVHLHRAGLKLHGFGFKIEGLRRVASCLTSADSMAWSYAGRYRACENGNANCANCFHWATEWREEVMRSIACPFQENLAYV